MSEQAPLVKTVAQNVDAVGATADSTNPVAEAPFEGAVTAVTYTPDSAITGANTETRTLTLVNKGSDGTGTTVVATLALTSGVNAAAFDEKALTLSVVAHATEVNEGDVLALASVHSGSSGLADPGGLVQVEFTRA